MGYMALLFGGWEVLEWMTEQWKCRQNAKLKSTEGRRGLGNGEGSLDEVCPRETANALPGICIWLLVE